MKKALKYFVIGNLLVIFAANFQNTSANTIEIPRYGLGNIGGEWGDARPQLCEDIIKESGAEIAMVTIRWGMVERKPGEYRITKQVLVKIEKEAPGNAEILLRIRPKCHWGTTEPWIDLDEFLQNKLIYPPKNYDDFGKFIEILADSLRGRVRFFQITNEPDLIRAKYGRRQWAGTIDELIKLVKVTSEALKKVNPDAYLIMSGFASGWGNFKEHPPHHEYFEEIVDGVRDYVDAFALHHYGEYGPLRRKIAWFSKICKKPVWLTEIGSPPGYYMNNMIKKMPDIFTELADNDDLFSSQMIEDSVVSSFRRQNPDLIYLPENREILEKVKSEDLVKLYSTAFAEEVPAVIWFVPLRKKKPKWYFGRPPRENARRILWNVNRRMLGAYRGLFDEALNEPTPAFYTYRLMTEKINGFSHAVSIGTKDVPAYEFHFPDGTKKYIIWSEVGNINFKFDLPDNKYRVIKIVTEMNKTEPEVEIINAVAGKLLLKVDSTPIIIEPE